MSDTLVIRLPELALDEALPLSWLLQDSQGQVRDQGETALGQLAAELAALSQDYQCQLLVPASAVLLTAATIPSRQPRHLRQALPFMVEELIADEIESVHLAVPQPLPVEGPVPVAVIRHSLLIDWLDQLINHQLQPRQLLPEVLLVPRKAGHVSLLLEAGQALVHQGEFQGLALPTANPELLATLLQGQFTDGEPLPALEVITCEGSIPANLDDILARLQQYFPELQHTRYREPVLALLAASARDGEGARLNLLQGGYSQRRQQRQGSSSWRPVATAAALALASYLAVTLGSGWYFQQQAAALNAESVAIYRSVFPDQQRVISPRRQMESMLRGQGDSAGSSFLPLLAQAATAFGSDHAINQLRYDPVANGLQVEVQTASIEALDQLKQTLSQAGLSVDINSATEQEQRVVGKLTVTN